MNDESNGTPKKPKTKMVARTTYRMDRGRLKRHLRWVRVRVTEEDGPMASAPRPKPKPTPKPAVRPSPRPASKPVPEPAPRPAPRPEPRPEPRRDAPPKPVAQARDETPIREEPSRPIIRDEPPRRPRAEARRPSRQPYRGGWQGPPEVTVVLRTFNCEATIQPLLDLIKAQEVPFRFDILAVHGRSQDRTLDILSQQGLPVLSIAQEDRFIDRAMDRAVGKVVLLT